MIHGPSRGLPFRVGSDGSVDPEDIFGDREQKAWIWDPTLEKKRSEVRWWTAQKNGKLDLTRIDSDSHVVYGTARAARTGIDTRRARI
jgi:hypothetical protein